MRTRLVIVLGYLGAIAAGALLLMLPASSAARAWMPVSDALFTACSAVCITGLSVIDVGAELSRFGQGVLLVLVQLGCMGTMTVGTFFLVVIGRRLSLAGEFSITNAYGVKGVRGWRGLVLWVVCSMCAIELAGMCALHAAVPDLGWFRSYFYAVMAFCNAGFSLGPASSLEGFQAYPLALVTMGALVTLGGLGFLVLYNLCTIQFWRRNLVARGRLSFHTRVVLLASLVLTVVALACVFGAEWNGALEPYSLAEKLGVGFFQAVTPRTCGFTVTPVQDLSPVTRFVSCVLMFIGAAPGGAGGGVKVTTCAVFVLAILAICRGQDAVTLFHRTVPEAVVREAMVIVTVMALLVVLGMTTLLVTENRGDGATPFEFLLFETVSAVSTTGLSCGATTASLSPAGRAVIMACMFCGRLGALAVVFLIGGRDAAPSRIRFPKEELVVG